MPPRLIELFPIGQHVEVRFGEDQWVRGIVTAHDHPGVWVLMAEGRQWFVTNRANIRIAENPPQN
jgi:hypothetical protein